MMTNNAATQPHEAYIWLTSDLHLGHDREFIWRPRGFQSCAEMSKEIVRRFNEWVRPQDEAWILGDLTLGDLNQSEELLRSLHGHIHVVLGNHDTARRQAFYESLGWDCHVADILKYKGYRFYLSHYPTITENLEAEAPKQAMINLAGHTHSKAEFYEDRPFCYNVSVDAHNCYPILIDTVIKRIYDKINECKQFLDE